MSNDQSVIPTIANSPPKTETTSLEAQISPYYATIEAECGFGPHQEAFRAILLGQEDQTNPVHAAVLDAMEVLWQDSDYDDNPPTEPIIPHWHDSVTDEPTNPSPMRERVQMLLDSINHPNRINFLPEYQNVDGERGIRLLDIKHKQNAKTVVAMAGLMLNKILTKNNPTQRIYVSIKKQERSLSTLIQDQDIKPQTFRHFLGDVLVRSMHEQEMITALNVFGRGHCFKGQLIQPGEIMGIARIWTKARETTQEREEMLHGSSPVVTLGIMAALTALTDMYQDLAKKQGWEKAKHYYFFE